MDNDTMVFEKRRRPLVESFLDLDEHRSPLALQHDIAAELRHAEMSAHQRTPELAWHKRLLRVIGDSLAFTFLHQHTIRTLARHPGQPPSLNGQRDDFAFTMDVAQVLAECGYVPIVSDLTNVLKVGDIAAVAAQHVLILECKNTALPARLSLSGRLARQRARGSAATEYLRNSRIPEPGGTREAIKFQLPQPHWDAVSNLADALSPDSTGAEMCLLGPGDAVGLATRDADLSAFLARLSSLVGGTTPMLATHLDLLRQPSWTCPGPLVFPLPRWVRHDLFEARAVMVRLIDIDRLTSTGRTASGAPVQLRCRHSAHQAQLTITIGTQDIELGPWLIEILMHTPTAVADLQQALLTQADMLVAISPDTEAETQDENDDCPSGTAASADDSHPYLADGDDVNYGTVYLNPDGEHHIVYQVSDESLAKRFHIAWSPSECKVVAVYRDGLRIEDPDLIARLARPRN
jgi:hypothetical protein